MSVRAGHRGFLARGALSVAVAAVALGPLPAHAIRVRLVNASELRLVPSLRPDGASLTVRARARDDRGAPVRGAVVLHVNGAADSVLHARTNEQGEALFEVRLGVLRVLEISAELTVGPQTAPARAQARVDLDASFLTLDVTAPASVDLIGAPFEATVAISVGEIAPLNPDGTEVQLSLDGASLGIARADATGRARFVVEPSRLATPGVHALTAEYARAGMVVRSPERRVLARARTALRVGRVAEREGAYELSGALASSAGALPDAPVRLFAGERALFAALTDARGHFLFRVPAEALVGVPGDAVFQVRFEPAEPWLTAARSEGVQLPRAVPVSVRWTWALAVVASALSLFAVARAWARRAGRREPESQPSGAAAAARGTRSLPPALVGDRTVRLRLEVFDRASGGAVEGAVARWVAPAQKEDLPAGEPVAVRGGLACAVEVRAPGYAPSVVRVEAPLAPGTHTHEIELTPWREALFARARGWIASAVVGGRSSKRPLPTPREALATHLEGRSPSAPSRALVTLVEQGVYGPDEPDGATVAAAEGLAAAAFAKESAAVGDVRAPAAPRVVLPRAER